MNPPTPSRATACQLRLVLGFCFFFSPFVGRGQGTQLKYDLSGNLTSISASVGTGPIIVGQPRSGVAAMGDPVSWAVLATGSMPLTYQWQLNSNNIPGATADTLLILSVAPPNFGAYRVMVNNASGSVTSSNAF